MRKKLLSEAQVRRFQSLASIKPLNEMDSSYKMHDDEDKMEEAYDDEAHMKDDMMEEEGEDMDVMADDDEGEEMDEADVELDEELVEKFMEAASTIQEVADALGGGAGGDLGADEPADEEPMELDAGGDEGGDVPALDAGGEEGGEEYEEAMLQEALRGISYVPSQKEIVSTVAKRVAKRLQEAKRAEARLNKALGRK